MRPLNLPPRSARRGATLVELTVSCVILIVLAGVVALAMQRADQAFRTTSTAADAENFAQRGVERVAQEFMDADRSSLTMTPASPLAANSVLFSRAIGYAGGGLLVGASRRIRFEYDPAEADDGADNDSDGLVDEGRVVLNDDVAAVGSANVVLVDNVREYLQGETANGADDNGNGLTDERGLAMTYDAATQTLTLRLTVGRRAADGTVVDRSAETAIRIRND